MSLIHKGLVKGSLVADTAPIRFEHFCCQLISAVEGGTAVVPTSANYDRGRDGRSVGRGKEIVLCATLRDDLDEKSEGDIRKVAKYGEKPGKVYYCSSQDLTEDRCIKLSSSLRDILGQGIEITVLGADHLADLSLEHPKAAVDNYHAELADLQRAFGDDGTETDERRALSLVMSTIGHEQSAEVRGAVYGASIRRVLSRGAMRIRDIGRVLGESFHLARSLEDGALLPHLSTMVSLGNLRLDSDGKYSLTEEGKAHAEKDKLDAATHLLDGRNLVRSQLEASIGQSLADDHYDEIWALFQEKCAHYFYTRGRALVRLVCEVLEKKGAEGNHTLSDQSLLTDLSTAAAATSTDPELAEVIKVAVQDMFTEQQGPAFDWLLEACASYVALCSMGLEFSSSERLKRIFSSMLLLLDTDVLLSYLGQGESNHEGAKLVVARWRSLGGKISFATPVVLEVAHHAWIATADYERVRQWLPGSDADRHRLVENVFVRSFAQMMSEGSAKGHQWPQYIAQFSRVRKFGQRMNTPVTTSV